jgi:hypothetical protein
MKDHLTKTLTQHQQIAEKIAHEIYHWQPPVFDKVRPGGNCAYKVNVSEKRATEVIAAALAEAEKYRDHQRQTPAEGCTFCGEPESSDIHGDHRAGHPFNFVYHARSSAAPNPEPMDDWQELLVSLHECAEYFYHADTTSWCARRLRNVAKRLTEHVYAVNRDSASRRSGTTAPLPESYLDYAQNIATTVAEKLQANWNYDGNDPLEVTKGLAFLQIREALEEAIKFWFSKAASTQATPFAAPSAAKPAGAQPPWIPVSEKLPDGAKLFTPMLVKLKTGEELIARRTWDEWVGEGDRCVQYVTHWASATPTAAPERDKEDGR